MPKKPTGNPNGRPATVAKKTSVGIRQGVDGWVAFRALDHGGIAGYLNDLAEADRDAALCEGGDVAERYRAYLVATGRGSELESIAGQQEAGES